MAIFGNNRRGTDTSLPKSDRGVGHFNDYSFDLLARNKNITMVLADSDPHQDELRTITESGEEKIETAISPRTLEQERTDDPIVVRLFTGRRVSGPVGSVPRGLESVVDETLRRLDDTVGKARIPARITHKSGVYRVELLMGEVR
ncbi:MAG: hypothetical protein M3N46_07390 [Actinomycetota bacterium]|nr:hypothetical protein [Actinomycetota bacterium]